MNIEITGCNNCMFRFDYFDSEYCIRYYFCALQENLNTSEVNTENKYNNFRTDIPENCPIKLNNGQITIKIKE